MAPAVRNAAEVSAQPLGSARTLALFAGPSGGHLFPAVAFAEAWKKRHPESRIHLVTSRKGAPIAEPAADGLFEKIHYLPNFPSSPGISLRTMGFLLKLAVAFIDSCLCLERIKPDLCVGFGSYVSYPGMMLSVWKKIPALIHEQNVIPGKATRWLARHVDCVAVSFPETLTNTRLKRVVCTGLPLRRCFLERRNALRATSTAAGKVRILVVGGSQGAGFLNRTAVDAFCLLSSEEKEKTAVIHITGAGDFEQVSGSYRGAGIEAEVYPFFSRMEELYGAVDLAVSRAGANTLFELALFHRPAVIIPYPYAGAHQIENARFFESRGGFLMREEKELTPASLRDLIRGLLKDPERHRRMAESLAALAAPEAPEKLADLAEDLCQRRHP